MMSSSFSHLQISLSILLSTCFSFLCFSFPIYQNMLSSILGSDVVQFYRAWELMAAVSTIFSSSCIYMLMVFVHRRIYNECMVPWLLSSFIYILFSSNIFFSSHVHWQIFLFLVLSLIWAYVLRVSYAFSGFFCVGLDMRS